MSTPIISVPPQAATEQYLALITSEHALRPNFRAFLSIFLQYCVDAQNQWAAFPSLYNISTAVGDQLDQLGVWVGVTRNLTEPLDGVSVLNDADYRVLLLAIIAYNHWDGTVPGAYAVWDVAFASYGFQVLIQDNQDMTMSYTLLSSTFSPVVLDLITNGYFDLRPAGVRLLGYFQPSVPGAPVFTWGPTNGTTTAGWGEGVWLEPLET